MPDETRGLLLWRDQRFQVGRKTGQRLLATATRGRTTRLPRLLALALTRSGDAPASPLIIYCISASAEREKGGVIRSQIR